MTLTQIRTKLMDAHALLLEEIKRRMHKQVDEYHIDMITEVGTGGSVFGREISTLGESATFLASSFSLIEDVEFKEESKKPFSERDTLEIEPLTIDVE